MRKSIAFLVLMALPFPDAAVAKVDDPQLTSALHLYNICLSHHVPDHARTREDHINRARCAARLSFEYRRVRKKQCEDPQGMARWFLEYWDSRGGIGLYDKEISETVFAMLNPPNIPKGTHLFVPGCE
jgi:hypothetical protein